jgi:hypothetical protein
MIKAVSTYPRGGHLGVLSAGDAQRAEVLFVMAKRGFGAYPSLGNASCLSSVVIGGRKRVHDAGLSHVEPFAEGFADSAAEHDEHGRRRGLANVSFNTLNPLWQLSVVIDRHRAPPQKALAASPLSSAKCHAFVCPGRL